MLDHDFPSWASGRGIPYGIYDVAHNDGYVVVGTSHETPRLRGGGHPPLVAGGRAQPLPGGEAVADPGRRRRVPTTPASGRGRWRCKRLADESGLIITVTHYPPGASKWNPIEHRMFSLISGNWAGEPLVSYETMLKFIRQRGRPRVSAAEPAWTGRSTRREPRYPVRRGRRSG